MVFDEELVTCDVLRLMKNQHTGVRHGETYDEDPTYAGLLQTTSVGDGVFYLVATRMCANATTFEKDTEQFCMTKHLARPSDGGHVWVPNCMSIWLWTSGCRDE